MVWRRLLGLLCALAVVLSAVGALASLATTDLFTGAYATAAAAVTALVVVSVVAMVLVGRRSDRWTDNPDYYW